MQRGQEDRTEGHERASGCSTSSQLVGGRNGFELFEVVLETLEGCIMERLIPRVEKRRRHRMTHLVRKLNRHASRRGRLLELRPQRPDFQRDVWHFRQHRDQLLEHLPAQLMSFVGWTSLQRQVVFRELLNTPPRLLIKRAQVLWVRPVH